VTVLIQLISIFCSFSAEVDGALIIQTPISQELDLPHANDNPDQPNHQQKACDPGPSNHRRIQSAQSSSFRSALMSRDNMLVNVDEEKEEYDQDSPVVPGMKRPASEEHRGISVPVSDPKRPVSEYDKFERWPWSNAKRLSISVQPFPLPSPGSPTFRSYLEDRPINTQQRNLVSSSIFRFKDRRRSMPLPSAAMATFLPWRGYAKRPSSEPELPSQSSSQSQTSSPSS
jgi:hypothetical protein